MLWIVNPTEPQEPFLDLQEAFEDLFSRVRYLGPRRDDPRHDYSWAESHPEDIGRRGEKMISALLSSRVQNRSIDEQIMKWLRELDLIYSYTLTLLPIQNRITNSSSNSTKMDPKSDSQTLASVFPKSCR